MLWRGTSAVYAYADSYAYAYSYTPNFELPYLYYRRVSFPSSISTDCAETCSWNRSKASANHLTPVAGMGSILGSDDLNRYDAIFINVAGWGADKHHFTDADIYWNKIWPSSQIPPPFVAAYLDKSDRKPGLSPDINARNLFDAMDPQCRTTYFVTADGLPASTGQRAEGRDANLQEVLHILTLSSTPWQILWQRPISHLTNALCFVPFLLTCRPEVTATLDTSHWPFPLIMKAESMPGGSEIRSYLPRSDFSLSYLGLPRVLVEVNSTAVSASGRTPPDLVRMLLCGASVVRFANGFMDPFKQHKDFVLAAIYIPQSAVVKWYTLYQNKNQAEVYYRAETFDLHEPVGRIKFMLRLYNLSFAFDDNGDASYQIEVYKLRIAGHVPKLKTFYTDRGTKHDATGSDESDARARARPREDVNTELEAHGYEVEPDHIETEHGTFESLRKLPSNLLTVFRPSAPNTMLVAKKIRKESNELEILRFIHRIQPQSEHIITLLDSFHGQSSSWAILPKIVNNVDDWLWYDPKQFSQHISQVCWGLIKGLAYLHEHLVAHRDIKPANLLVDHKFCLKIIDFDVAVQVRDDEDEVDDHCGTDGWVAPEIEARLPTYCPIKADRWSCGAVILFIFGRARQTDTMLEGIATKLKVDAPKDRPPLVEWPAWSQLQAALAVDAGTSGKREWSPRLGEETPAEAANEDTGKKRARIDKQHVRNS
ncbi:hypothetical protein AB1N83_009025 [Pleurotus pulmonarius]